MLQKMKTSFNVNKFTAAYYLLLLMEYWKECGCFKHMVNRPFSKMAAEISNKLKLGKIKKRIPAL